ncbi:kelch-like protein 12 isoform X2 [Xenia sp. Carnegie-2017]|nr:kelch-like protein 12 isoform X2 [Xenia sp. Carnegie-2017]
MNMRFNMKRVFGFDSAMIKRQRHTNFRSSALSTKENDEKEKIELSKIYDVTNEVKGNILIAGGLPNDSQKRTEIYSWKDKKWFEISAMENNRLRAASFNYGDSIFVVGGCKSIESIEMMNFNLLPLTWQTFPIGLDYKCGSHKIIVFKQQVICIGGYDLDNNSISSLICKVQICDAASDLFKELCHMPEPRRNFGAEIVDDKVLIFGGWGKYGNTLSSVIEFDPMTHTFKKMPSLPHSMTGMSTVTWRDQVVLLGGRTGHGRFLNDVKMYDSKTGKITTLPPMLEKRLECCAIITGDTIVVMGGQNEEGKFLKSVECFNIEISDSWTYLPSMNSPRHGAIAEVLPLGQRYK